MTPRPAHATTRATSHHDPQNDRNLTETTTSTETAMTAQPIQSLDDDVTAYLDLTDRIEQLESQRTAIRARLVQRGVGEHSTTSGVKVSVTAPNRRFNLDKAWGLLTTEQQAVCMSPDLKKVKGQLAPVLAESCMEPGTGAPRVVVK